MRLVRHLSLSFGLAVAAIATGTAAIAFWATTGIGSASAPVATLDVPTSVSATPSGTTVAVSWAAPGAPDGGPVDGYYIERSSGTPAGSCASSPTSLIPASSTSCSDVGVPSGSYAYTVVAVFRSWTSSSSSGIVNVAGALHHFDVAAPSSSNAGAALNVTVTAKDSSGNTVTGYTGTVQFTSTDPQAVLPSNYTFVAGDSGTHLFANGVTFKTAGGQTVTVADAAATSKTGAAVVSVGAATANKLRFSQPPTNAVAGGTITPAVTVRIEDEFGNLTSSTANVTMAVTGGGVTLNGTTARAASGGVATFDDLSVNMAGSYTLTATSPSIANGTSSSFTVSAAAANKLRFAQSPTNAVAGATITPAVTVRIEDEFGNLTSSTANVSMAVSGGAVTLNGTTTRAAVGGIATFNNLTVNTAGSYTLTASSGSLVNAISSSFTITAAAASKLCVVATLPTCTGGTLNVANGSTTTTQVRIYDQFGNVATGSSGITVTLSKTGQVDNPPNSVTIAAGQNTSGSFSVTINSGSNKSGTVKANAPGLAEGTFTLQSP